MYMALLCSKTLRRNSPGNYICLGLFTVSMAIDVGCVCMLYEIESVISALMMTLGITACLTVYALKTDKDITISNVWAYLCLVSLGHLFLWLFFGRMQIVNVLGIAIAAVSFCFWLVHDIQTLMAGKRIQIQVDDYIYGAIVIYMDIVDIFLKILELMGDKKKKNKDEN